MRDIINEVAYAITNRLTSTISSSIADEIAEGVKYALSHQWRRGKIDGYPKERETVIGAVFDDSGYLYGLWQVQYLGKEYDGVPIYKTVSDGERINVTHWMPIPKIPSLNPEQR